MNPNYNEEQNPQIMPLQPAKSGGFMEYVKNNKVTVFIVILIIIGLIWWFCIKKTNGKTGLSKSTGTPSLSSTGTPINITRSRLY